MNNYELRRLMGLPLVSFRSYISGKNIKVLESRQFTQSQLDEVPEICKGYYNGSNVVVVYENSKIALVPVKLVESTPETIEIEQPIDEAMIDKAKDIITNVQKGSPPHEAKNEPTLIGKEVDSDYTKTVIPPEPIAPDDQETRDQKVGQDILDNTKIDIPAKVKSQISDRIKHLKDAKEKFDNKGFNDHSQKDRAIEVLELMQKHLDGTLNGINNAKVLYSTLNTSITELMPSAMTVFILGPYNYKK